MWHATSTQVNQGDFHLLMVESQIGNVTFGPSFGHNLYKTILDIYVQRDFQWYNKLFNPMSFDLCNRPLKIRKCIGTLTPKLWECEGSFLHISYIPRSMKCDLRISLLAPTFANLRLSHKPKTKTTTRKMKIYKRWFIPLILHMHNDWKWHGMSKIGIESPLKQIEHKN
jgi:hypothetical protein